MSEFNQTLEEPSSTEPVATINNGQRSWLTRPIILGLSIPWLVGIAALLAGACWYEFAPERSANTANQLAFEDSSSFQPVKTSAKALVVAEPGPDLTLIQDQMANVIKGVRSDNAANTEALSRLAETTKTLVATLATVQQQLSETQAQVALLSARSSSIPESRAPSPKPQSTTAVSRSTKSAAPARPPLPDMHLSAVQNGMAWVQWQDKTWAVQAGDNLGPVTITAIDAQNRQVHTSGGTLK